MERKLCLLSLFLGYGKSPENRANMPPPEIYIFNFFFIPRLLNIVSISPQENSVGEWPLYIILTKCYRPWRCEKGKEISRNLTKS